MVKRSWKCNDKYCSESYIYDDKGVSEKFFNDYPLIVKDKVLDTILSKKKDLIVLTDKAIITIDKNGNILQRVESFSSLTNGILNNNLDGDIMAIAVDSTDMVVASDLKEWIATVP
ncbi:MAG: hypothetical protein HQK76_07550 [Desulfobacterales bacterium]|nr:hypothetical protein [Desulfobacterales bacterium]